jgi:Fe-S-cluster containining protein
MKGQLNGNPCEDCGECCLNTEMILSENDIDLIINNSGIILKKEEFVRRSLDGLYQILNFEGHCIFLNNETKLCKIYEIRPKGCRFYPFIYDLEKRKCKYDEECPRFKKFQMDSLEEKEQCRKLKTFLTNELSL